jgi:hypothetical protein
VVRERDFRLVADRILNLSPDGLLAGPADPTLTGEKLIVSFKVPRSAYWVDVEATVTRVVHGRRPGDHTRALGIEFEGLGRWAKFVLERNLKRLPAAPPGASRALS